MDAVNWFSWVVERQYQASRYRVILGSVALVSLKTIEGICPDSRGKLFDVSIKTSSALLKRCGAQLGRRSVASETGISEQLILGWVKRVDLMRVRGIGSEYSDLLEASGVETIIDLRGRKPANLAETMAEVNRQAIKTRRRSIVRRAPSEAEVERWVAHASELAPMVSN